MATGISYTSRNFNDIRTDLVNLVKQYYPSIFNDFNDASVGMMLLELNAAVGDMLSFNTDRLFQETQIDYAQQNSSVLSMARTFGLKIPGNRPSVTLVDFSVTVPVFGNTFDITYAPVIRQGSQVSGAGKIFQTQNDIDFSNPFTTGGIPNRLIIPNFDSNNNLINYTLTKREIVINGYTKIYTQVIDASDVVPFFEVVLPDNNVLSINSVITLNGTNFVQDPTLDQFLDNSLRWWEMDALAEDTVFIPDTTVASDNAGVKPGTYISVTQKFITEYTDLGFFKLTFGGGTQDISSLTNFDTNQVGVSTTSLVNQIGDFINNMSLGVTPTAGTTMFISYNVGGGADTNVGANTITDVGVINISVNGAVQATNNAVIASLSVNNAFPALGGRDMPTVEEVRYLVKYNFSAQNRAVTIPDYQSLIALMPGTFGVPFRCGVFEQQNKINVYILGLDQNGNLSNTSNNTLKNNITTYLSNYRMINDYVTVTDGQIINLAFEFDIFADKQFSTTQIASQIITEVQQYMDINNFQMGQSVYLGDLLKEINQIGGVINVIGITVYNEVGGIYSVNQTSQALVDATTGEIDISQDYTLYGQPEAMFEILNPSTDITVRIKN